MRKEQNDCLVILLNGTSSSGKTSLAKTLQRLSPEPMLHTSLDTFVDMFCWEAIPNNEIRRQCHTTGVHNFHQALPLLASSGFPLVIDHVFERDAWYEATMAALAEHHVFFVGVRCPLEVLEERERQRGDRRIGMARSQYEKVHQGKVYDIEIDTSKMTPDEGATLILSLFRGSGRCTTVPGQ